MIFESFFPRRQETPRKEGVQQSDTEDPRDISRRTFLKALAGAVVASIAIPEEAHADGEEKIKKNTPERKKENRHKIETYLETLEKNPDVFKNGSKTTMFEFLNSRADFSREMIEGTLFDRQELFKAMTSGSWPSVQAWQEKGSEIPKLRFSHQLNPSDNSDNNLGNYANSFFVNGAFVTNRHVAQNPTRSFPKCQTHTGGIADIVACPKEVLAHSPDVSWFDIDVVNLKFDSKSMGKDVHGKLVHIPSIHETRSSKGREDDATLVTGVLIKITPNMLMVTNNPNGFIAVSNKETGYDYSQTLLRSYLTIIPSVDANGDGSTDTDDVLGISGSPVFLESDCREKCKTPSGIVWGTGIIKIPSTGERYTVVFVHGPDVLGEMLQQVGALEK